MWASFGSFRYYPFIPGGGVFLTLYIPIQVRVLQAIVLNKHIYIHVKYHHSSLPCEKSAEMYSKVTCCLWNDAKDHNYDEPGTDLFRNNRFVSRVGLNLISQHIKLRGKTNKYALFSPFTNLHLRTGAISKLNFICSIRFIAQFITQQVVKFRTSHITRCSLTILGLKR